MPEASPEVGSQGGRARTGAERWEMRLRETSHQVCQAKWAVTRKLDFVRKCDGTTLDIVKDHAGGHVTPRPRRGESASRETCWEAAAAAQAGGDGSLGSMEEVGGGQIQNLFWW